MAAQDGPDAPDIGYVRLVGTDRYTSDSIDQVPATMHLTFIWRTKIAFAPSRSWRIHYLGEPVDPGLALHRPGVEALGRL